MGELNKDYIDGFINSNLKKKNNFLEVLEAEALDMKIPIIDPDVGQFIRFLIKLKKPRTILEIGTAVGYSGLVILDASDDIKKLTTIEKRDDLAAIAKENFQRAGEEKRVEIILGDADLILSELEIGFDFIFIDAAKGQYSEYFNHALRLLNPGGFILCDNVLFKGMVANEELVEKRKKTIVKRLRSFIKEVMEMEEVESSLIAMGDGLLVSVKDSK